MKIAIIGGMNRQELDLSRLAAEAGHTIEWHDGTVEVLPLSLSPALYPLEPGDSFSAFVKVGKENRALSIERVSLIPA